MKRSGSFRWVAAITQFVRIVVFGRTRGIVRIDERFEIFRLKERPSKSWLD